MISSKQGGTPKAEQRESKHVMKHHKNQEKSKIEAEWKLIHL